MRLVRCAGSARAVRIVEQTSLTMGKYEEFVRDQAGGVALIFAASAPVAALIVFGSLDYSRMVGARARLQSATDFAALALAMNAMPTTTQAMIAAQAASAIAAAAGSGSPSVVSVSLSNNNTQVCLTTSQPVLSIATRIVGIGSTTVQATSCATTNSSIGGAFEIALALDNTGSMASSAGGRSKLDSAKTAALSLVDQLSSSGANARFSVVPFSTSVNVGASYLGESWLDTAGRSSIHWQDFQRPAGASWLPTSRFDLLTQMNVAWAGCVEERPDPYLTTDFPATPAQPDSLFVPYFWPDEGDIDGLGAAFLPGMNVLGNGRGAKLYSSSNWDFGSAKNNYLYDFGGICTASASDPYVVADVADALSRGGGSTKLCKYKGATGVSSKTSSAGPNRGCMDNPLLPLSSAKSDVVSKIKSMDAGGTTNLLPGFMWAWRTVSPNGPFTGASTPKPYGAAGNTKIIIFMTDGFNNWSANSGYAYKSEYNALGYYANNRLSAYGGAAFPPPTGSPNYDGPTNSSNWRMQMDSALLAACTNAKNAGVTVYTVGFSVPSDPIDTEGLQLLSKCASGADHAYVARDSSSIVTVFNTIGSSLSKLRLVR